MLIFQTIIMEIISIIALFAPTYVKNDTYYFTYVSLCNMLISVSDL